MSSLRNAINRRVHRERDQPLERKKLGHLEKHKDYSLRAADYNKKKKQLKALRHKAAERNEDEFFFGMTSRAGPGTKLTKGKRWDGTVAGDRGNKALGMEEVRLMKTQDIGYLRTARNVTSKEVKGLEERVVGLGGGVDAKAEASDEDDEWEDEGPPKKKAKKIVFSDAVSEREERMQVDLEDDEEDDGQDEEGTDAKENPEALRAELRQRLLVKLQRRLQIARKRLKVLSTAENELEMQRAKMAKTATVGGVTKTGKRFKVRARKR